MKTFKPDWNKIGGYVIDSVRNASGPILSGIGMLGLAMIAKKLNIPYQVLLDPSYSMRSGKIAQISNSSGLAIMPNNSVEAAIGAILESSRSNSDYYKFKDAQKIYDLIAYNIDILDDRTKSYAIMALNNMANACNSSYYTSNIVELIAKIGSGDY